MKVKISQILLSGILLLGLPAISYAANKVFLGSRVVSDRAEYDTIKVGADEGRFSAIQLKAKGARVEFKRVVVHFANGGEQRFEKNVILKPGHWSRRIDLKGDDRVISKVVFYYETRSAGFERAVVELRGVR